MIRIDKISKQNGHQIFFIEASADILRSEKVGLVGSNGAGKWVPLPPLYGEGGERHRAGWGGSMSQHTRRRLRLRTPPVHPLRGWTTSPCRQKPASPVSPEGR